MFFIILLFYGVSKLFAPCAKPLPNMILLFDTKVWAIGSVEVNVKCRATNY